MDPAAMYAGVGAVGSAPGEAGEKMLRMGALVLGMEIAAVAFAVYGFGWLVLLVGAPLILVTLLIVLVAAMSERNRRIRQSRADEAAQARKLDPEGTVYLGRGLMSGFFELPGAAGLPVRPEEQKTVPQIPTQPVQPPAPRRVRR